MGNRIEKELPLALRAMATDLSVNTPFERCIENLHDGYGELSGDFRRITRMIDSGSSVPEALLDWAEKSGSCQARRAANQLVTSYEKRDNPEALKKLSEDMLNQQRTAMREYSGQLTVYSLMFITVSAVFPALFQAFVIVGSSFMSHTVTPEQALLIPVIGFPVVDVAILALIRARRPL